MIGDAQSLSAVIGDVQSLNAVIGDVQSLSAVIGDVLSQIAMIGDAQLLSVMQILFRLQDHYCFGGRCDAYANWAVAHSLLALHSV